MERNPYAPPNTPVPDIAGPSVIANREVLIACKLYWITFGFSLVGSATALLTGGSTMQAVIAGVIGVMFGGAIGFAITAWIVSKLKAGRNWMRLLLTIGAVLGFLSIPIFWKFYSSVVFPIYASNPIKAGIAVLEMIPNTWAIVLLNVPRSRAWFSATKRRE
jgi:hypothetical protein